MDQYPNDIWHAEKKGCKCQGENPALHGPYFQWSSKFNGKTKTVRLKSSEINNYKGWINEGKRLDKLITQWKEMSLERVRVEKLNRKN